MSNTEQVAEWKIDHMQIRVKVDLDPISCVPRIIIESDSGSIMNGIEVIVRNGKNGAMPTSWRKWQNSEPFTLKQDI